MPAMPDDDPPFLILRRDGERVVVRGTESWASGPHGKAATVWAEWGWTDGGLTARVDRYGFYTLFWYEKDGVVAVSPSLVKLVAEGCDATQDARALAVFHRIGIFVNDDTPLKHVKTLPPGGVLTWDGTSAVRVESGATVPGTQEISREGAVEGMITHFRSAVARALEEHPGPFHVPLSGGRDSRHILLEVLHQGRRPETCVTFHHNGAVPNREAMAARALCERLGVTHEMLGFGRPRLADTLRALVMTSLCADEHAQMMPLNDYFLGRDAVSFDGIAGDILTNPDDSADWFMGLSRKGDWKGIAQGMIDGHGRVVSQSHWGKGAGPIYSPGMDEEVRDYVAPAIAQYADAPDPYQMFWMFHRTRREINFVPQAILGSARHVFCPYLDPEFVEFCISLPYSVTKDQQLHNDAIARAYPEVADIPYQEGFPEPRVRRNSKLRKLGGVRDAAQIVAALGGESRVQAFLGFVRFPDKLTRHHGDIYALHALSLDGLDAAKARRLLDLAARLRARRPGRLISDRYEGA